MAKAKKGTGKQDEMMLAKGGAVKGKKVPPAFMAKGGKVGKKGC